MTRHASTIKYQSSSALLEPKSDPFALLARQPIGFALMCAIAFGIGFMVLAVGLR